MRAAVQTILVLSLLALWVGASSARTWHVERDGSGDFVVIQDAVDAASPGDIIQLGPGRFDEWEFRQGNPQYPVYVQVEKNLSFVGAGMGATIIGPVTVEVHPPNQYYVTGILVYGTNMQVSIRDLTVENCRGRGVDLYSGRLEMDRCEVRGCLGAGVFGDFPLGGWIRDCSFHDMGVQTVGLNFYTPSVGVEVTRCTFVNIDGRSLGAYWSGCRDIAISDCHFEHGITGVGFSDGASGSIRQCTFNGFSNWGIILDRCGSVVVEDNEVTQIGEFGGVGVAIWYYAQSVTMRRNIVISDRKVLDIDALIVNSDIRDNHFLREGDSAWWVWMVDYYPLPEPRIIDLEHNYWGTTDTALLDQWILDGNDNEDTDIFIDYLPLADGPVQTERTTWGAVKSLFRGERD
jgi:hypothetical protein